MFFLPNRYLVELDLRGLKPLLKSFSGTFVPHGYAIASGRVAIAILPTARSFSLY